MKKINLPVFLMLLFLVQANANALTESAYNGFRGTVSSMALPDRIAFWAEQFIGTPYDTDPSGEYVTGRLIVADDRVDCMYLTFRAAELALSGSYEEAVSRALDLRFVVHGSLDATGHVINYEDRFQYGEDMILSGKWGRNITGSLSKTVTVQGARGIPAVEMINRASAPGALGKIRNGDIIFFVKDPSKRKVGEIVGHMGIAVVKAGEVSLVHASGSKSRGGVVKKVSLRHYLETMPFIGIMVTRLD